METGKIIRAVDEIDDAKSLRRKMKTLVGVSFVLICASIIEARMYYHHWWGIVIFWAMMLTPAGLLISTILDSSNSIGIATSRDDNKTFLMRKGMAKKKKYRWRRLAEDERKMLTELEKAE